MAKLALTWSDAWSAFKGSSTENQRLFAVQLEETEGGFTHWIRTRSPKVQCEILENAPEGIVRYLYDRNILAVATIIALNIEPRKTKVVDRRKKAAWLQTA
jgi:hypothetical protein